MDPSMFNGIDRMLTVLFFTTVISLPFGVWKIVELVFYVVTHLRWEG
jgi:hypothetical protein